MTSSLPVHPWLLAGLVITMAVAVRAQSPAPLVRLVISPAIRQVRPPRPVDDFGTIAGMATDRHARLFVLDSELGALFAFDSAGRSFGSSGRPGLNAGELAVPTAVTTAADGRVFVLDARAQRVSEYRLVDEQVKWLRSFGVAVPGVSMCMAAGRLFVLGLHGGAMVHSFDTQGRLLKSFGEPFATGGARLQRSMGRGHLTCTGTPARVVVASLYTPDVRAYSVDGDLVWQQRLSGYQPVDVTEVSARAVSFSIPPGGHHMLAAMWAPDAGAYLAVQLGVVPGASSSSATSKYSHVETRFLSVTSGQEVGRQADLPLIGSASGSIAYTMPWRRTDRVGVVRVNVARTTGRVPRRPGM